MPSGVSASIGAVNSDTITINFTSKASNTPLNGHDGRAERSPTWVFSINGKNTTVNSWSGSQSISYDRVGLTSNTAITNKVKILFSCEVQYSDKYWEFSKRAEFTSRKTSTSSIKYDFVDSYVDDAEKTIYIYDIYTRETSYTDWTEYTFLNDSKSFYPRQKNFTFNNCSSGRQWLVESGINSLITNIESFKYYATQWRAWKNQGTSSGACPSFFSNNTLTATQLNSVYRYVKGTQPWSAGQEVSAAMFNDLATTINN